MKKWKAFSFFSGAGGLDLGFERAGIEIKFCLEKEPLFCETLRLNHPHLSVFSGDIMDYDKEKIIELSGTEEVDIMFGGSPCQSFSVAGKKKGFLDPRGGTMIKFAQLIEEFLPKIFVIENVRGFYSSIVEHSEEIEKEFGFNAETFPCTSFEFLARFLPHYDFISPKLLNSADYGVPQKRERVFLIGIKKGLPLNFEYPIPTHSEKEWIPFQSVMEQLMGIQHHYIPLPKRIERLLAYVPLGGGYWRDLPEELHREALGGSYTSGGGKTGVLRRIRADKPSPTLLTSPTQNSTLLAHPFELRPLSIEEYLAIQTFPQDYQIAGTLRKQYVQIGNAVPVQLAEKVGGQIVSYLNNLN